jgi:hypothetical protein
MRQKREMIGKLGKSFCAVFSAVYRGNGLEGDLTGGGKAAGRGGSFLVTSVF